MHKYLAELLDRKKVWLGGNLPLSPNSIEDPQGRLTIQSPDPPIETMDTLDQKESQRPYTNYSDDHVEWVRKKGPSALRKLRTWALENHKMSESEKKLLYWTARDLDRKKRPTIYNALKVRGIFEKAIKEGFSER